MKRWFIGSMLALLIALGLSVQSASAGGRYYRGNRGYHNHCSPGISFQYGGNYGNFSWSNSRYGAPVYRNSYRYSGPAYQYGNRNYYRGYNRNYCPGGPGYYR